jgi:hypothetical protein
MELFDYYEADQCNFLEGCKHKIYIDSPETEYVTSLRKKQDEVL